MKNCFLSLLLIFFFGGLFTQQSYGGNGITGKPVELRTLTYNTFNKKVYSDKGYNAKGQLEKTSLPYFSTDAAPRSP